MFPNLKKKFVEILKVIGQNPSDKEQYKFYATFVYKVQSFNSYLTELARLQWCQSMKEETKKTMEHKDPYPLKYSFSVRFGKEQRQGKMKERDLNSYSGLSPVLTKMSL